MAYVIVDGKKVDIKKGQNFMDIEEEAGIPFACRAGVCQTCAVTVKKGEEFLPALNDNEEMMGAEGNHRLGCQLSCESDDPNAQIEVEIGWI
ncbi:MAG: 2Fe-2S iron-sulfur cluster-binding protein [Candidatus Peregrinibacteria bacterium]|nr:2Fe-2S iron-sulfur cluster-binding protein [Candidatus Peregrinibacteria bacterium]MDZ4245333.1 2Fe-2S iron-sulfur cluster-binding protein [Candidatus Gracilibacteria bacterium]